MVALKRTPATTATTPGTGTLRVRRDPPHLLLLRRSKQPSYFKYNVPATRERHTTQRFSYDAAAHFTYQANWLTLQIGNRSYGLSKYRIYDPELGIFLSRDFLNYPNKYRAWSNNPADQVDNNGLYPSSSSGNSGYWGDDPQPGNPNPPQAQGQPASSAASGGWPISNQDSGGGIGTGGGGNYPGVPSRPWGQPPQPSAPTTPSASDLASSVVSALQQPYGHEASGGGTSPGLPPVQPWVTTNTSPEIVPLLLKGIPPKIGVFYKDWRLWILPLFPPAGTIELVASLSGDIVKCCDKKGNEGLMFQGSIGLELSGGVGTSIGGSSGVRLNKRSKGDKYWYYNQKGKKGSAYEPTVRRRDKYDPAVYTRTKKEAATSEELPNCETNVQAVFTVGVSGFASVGWGDYSVGGSFNVPIGSCTVPGKCAWLGFSQRTSGVTYGLGTGARIQVYGNASISGSLWLV